MKRSSHPFQLFAACAMSSRFPVRSNQNAVYYRGGRNQWHRGFSGRPSSREDDFVTGDSHFSSVRDENLGLRHGGREDLANNTGFQPRHFSPGPVYHQNQPSYPRVPFSQNQSFNPRPHFNQNQSFNPGPRFNQNQPFNPPPRFQQNQPFRQSQPFRPRPPKSLDYRNWEYTKPGPPPHCERFIVLSYNLLADYLAINHRSKLYFHIPHHILDWEWRKRNILFELGLWSADIMCFQEVDRFHELEEELKLRGYSGIWKMRTGDPNDGCAIFWRASRFKLLHEECIEFNKLGLRDNVAQISVLESVRNHTENMSAQQTSSTGSNKVVMCNIHVLYNPRRGEIKLGQLRALLDRAHAISRIWNDAPVVLCGDFNCTPKSPLYNYISEQKLDVFELERDKLSGQASAEIHAPRPFFPNPWSQSSKNSPYPPRFVHEKEGGIKQNNFVSDMQNQSNLNNKVENLSFWNSLQPGCSDTQMDVPNKSCIDGQPGDQNTSSDEVRTEIQQDSVNCFKDDIETTTAVRLEGSKESPSSSHSECGFPADPINDGIHEFTPPVASDATIETEHVTSHPVPVEVDVSSESVANEENCDPSPVYQVDLIRNLQDLSSESVANEVKSGLDIDTGVEANMENLTLDEFDEIITGDENLGENDFIPAMNSEPIEMERTPYDPSSWTPMEIETATGKADCTLLEHSLNLRSTYTEVEDFSGTRDSNGEPIATSYNRCFLGTVDYIWRSEGLETVRVLAPLPKQAMQWTPGFPTKKWGSDHIALASELAFVGKCDDQNREG